MTKKIINNRMYNTETAKQLGYWSNGYTPSDFYFAEETLYQKKTGEYFGWTWRTNEFLRGILCRTKLQWYNF